MSFRFPYSPGLIDSLKTAVVLIDTQQMIVWANSAAEEFLQISNNRLKSYSIVDFFENKNLIQDCLERLSSSDSSIVVKEIALRPPTQKRKIVTCAFNPITQADTYPAAEIFATVEIILENRFSIFETKQNDQTNNNNQSLLQGMAHEIKNPLGGIRGAAQLLAENLSGREDKDYLNIILHETDRLNQLVDRMSGHIKDKRMLSINVHRILEHIYRLIKADDGNNFQLKRDYDPSLPEITGSETSLTQALLNLVLNASQAIDDDGEIILRSRMVYATVIEDQQYRQVIRIDVQDNGPGIDETIRANIFEPLISSKSQGTGIGLSITREIISMHNGKIEFSSEPGKTVFSVFLPVPENKP